MNKRATTILAAMLLALPALADNLIAEWWGALPDHAVAGYRLEAWRPETGITNRYLVGKVASTNDPSLYQGTMLGLATSVTYQVTVVAISHTGREVPMVDPVSVWTGDVYWPDGSTLRIIGWEAGGSVGQ